MTRNIFCRVRHDPPNSYGDCLRACVATIMSMEYDSVPHFVDGDPEIDEFEKRLSEFFEPLGFARCMTAFDGQWSLEIVLEYWGASNPDVLAILTGGTGGGDHSVVVRGDKIIHNPALAGSRIIGPASSGYWQFMVIAKK